MYMPSHTVFWDDRLNVAVRELLEPVVPVIELLTHLGDGAFLIALGVIIYWFGDDASRRDRAFVLAVGIAALALAAGIKGIVQLERPELAFTPAGYPGYTFPSAHALGAAAFYSALAVTVRLGRQWQRTVIATLIIALVALSRIVMGVHYLGDVVIGVVLGVGLVAAGIWWREEGRFNPGPVFIVAAAVAIVTVALGSRQFVSMAIGAGVGGAAGWYAIRDRLTSNHGTAILVTGVLAIAGLLVVRALSLFLTGRLPSLVESPALIAVETVAYAALTAAVIVTPRLALRFEAHPLVNTLDQYLPFLNRRVAVERLMIDD